MPSVNKDTGKSASSNTSSRVLVYSTRHMRLWRFATRLKLLHVGVVAVGSLPLLGSSQAAMQVAPVAATVAGLSAVGLVALSRFAQRVRREGRTVRRGGAGKGKDNGHFYTSCFNDIRERDEEIHVAERGGDIEHIQSVLKEKERKERRKKREKELTACTLHDCHYDDTLSLTLTQVVGRLYYDPHSHEVRSRLIPSL